MKQYLISEETVKAVGGYFKLGWFEKSLHEIGTLDLKPGDILFVKGPYAVELLDSLKEALGERAEGVILLAVHQDVDLEVLKGEAKKAFLEALQGREE